MKKYQLKPIQTPRKTKQNQYKATKIQSKTFMQRFQEELKVNNVYYF